VLPVGGGEAEKSYRDVKSGVGNFDWSRDGNMIAFIMTDARLRQRKKKIKNQRTTGILWMK
jgi:dipeptidyl aminopeptidase/acylaminoacyl peptidase